MSPKLIIRGGDRGTGRSDSNKIIQCSGPVSPVSLESLQVPPVIRNGSVDHVVLDCPYSLQPGERDGIVLKWYLNSNTVPIYQWIPPSHPQGLGSMRHKIDLDYEISADPYKRHRALYISQPSLEMSGEYTCKVRLTSGQ